MGKILNFIFLVTIFDFSNGDTATFPPLKFPKQEIPKLPASVNISEEYVFHKIPRVPSRKVISLPINEKTRASMPIYTMSMKVDNFNPSNTQTFNMRYAVNTQFYNPTTGGPLFLFVGGESNMEDALGYLLTGLMYNAAQANKAYMAVNEHRFYGLSIPNMSFAPSNMQYLRVNQSLADLARFITNMKTANPKITKVILFGGSYPGSLAAWMRLFYPNLVTGAISASGITTLQVDNYGYNEVVKSVIQQYSPACMNTITNGVSYLNNIINNGYAGWVQNYFNLSYPLNYTSTQQYFFSDISYTIGMVVQYDQQAPGNTVATMCGNFTKNSNLYTDTQRFLMVMKNALSTGVFAQGYDSNADYAWSYQVCAELGNFVTTDSNNQMYGRTVPLSMWLSNCATQYFNTTNTNYVFNGNCFLSNYTIGTAGATKIMYVIGANDPWKAVGMLTTPNSLSPVVIVPGSSHCAVLLPASQVNSTSLAAARAQVMSTVSSWLV